MEPISGSMILGGAAISGVAQIVGQLMQGGEADQARALIERAVREYGPEAYGIIEKELGGPSAMSEVYGERLAPEASAAQKRALQQLQQVSETGYTPEEEAALRRIQAETAATAASQRAATQEAFARRGISGGGAERVAAFQGAQAAANRAAQGGLDVAAAAQRRAFQAMQAQGQLGGQIRGQAFGEASQRAQAEDELRRMRGQMKLNVAGQKAGMQTGSAESGYKYGALPGQQVAAIGTSFGTPIMAAGFDSWAKQQKKKEGE